MGNIREEALELQAKLRGKLQITSKIPITSMKDLSLAYTPGVAEPCIEILRHPEKVFDYTMKGNTVAIITDGSAVLGLGDIGPEASLPVMEGKALLLKEFAGIDSFPLALKTKNVDELVSIIRAVSPVFGAINLEDISAPRCFEVEEKLQDLGIPVMHDDQHGTAIVVLAALMNALKAVGKDLEEAKVVVSGSGAAGIAVGRLLTCLGYDRKICTSVKEIFLVDSSGIIYNGRKEGMNKYKDEIASITNKEKRKGSLKDALEGADVFIGVSRGNLASREMISSMAENAIVFPMANPTPEIPPNDALAAGAAIVGTGRSDFPNQINNVLAFPGIFRGALAAKAVMITPAMRVAAARTLASCISNPSREKILPNALDKTVVPKIAEAVKRTAIDEGVVRG